ncbi:MAG: Flp pilus assembly complex ATPase component TadA, partial [Deltaproteobacteria bacterium]|nr:Flp pilus assembly complex ATPase component TadA [Deltaproteobacteria bacterium]
MTNLRLGELLVRSQLINDEQLKKAMEEQKKNGGRLGPALIKLGFIDDKNLTAFLAKQYGVSSVDLDSLTVDPAVIRHIPVDVAQKYQVIPIARAGNNLKIAMSDPSNLFAIDDIKFMTGFNIEVAVSHESAIKRALDKYYDQSSSFAEVMGSLGDIDLELMDETDEIDVQELKHASEDAPVVKLVNLILSDAIKKGASDIHIETYEKSFRVRFRIDGTLIEAMNPPVKLRAAIISRVKIMSEMDIAERRLPQDGRIKIKLPNGRDMDFRVSSLPTLFGEKVVLRLLDKGSLQLDMTKLGYEPKALEWFKEQINKPFGMILVTGPTGSGKT